MLFNKIIVPFCNKEPFLIKTTITITLEDVIEANKMGLALICGDGKIIRIEEDIQ